jgi:hypothetical protein
MTEILWPQLRYLLVVLPLSRFLLARLPRANKQQAPKVLLTPIIECFRDITCSVRFWLLVIRHTPDNVSVVKRILCLLLHRANRETLAMAQNPLLGETDGWHFEPVAL